MRGKKSIILLAGCLVVSLALLVGGCDTVQNKTTVEKKIDYPTKPINFIVPFSAGGGMDLQARALEKVAVKHLGQPIVVMNKAGGSGSVGWNELIASDPDGYTVSIADNGILMLPLYGKTKYHYPTALEPIAQLSESPFVLVVNADQPWQNVSDLVAASKQQVVPLKFGHGGVGTPPHIVGATFAKEAGIVLEQVPFRSGGEALGALLGNHVQVVFANLAALKEQIEAGKVRALGVAGDQRINDPVLAQIPTLKEQGIAVSITNWRCVVAPKNMPAAIKAKMESSVAAMIADPEFKETMEKMGLEVNYLNAVDTQKKWQKESEELEKILNETGILEQIKAQRK